MRNFRDHFLKSDFGDGELLVTEYYRIAPILVGFIEAEKSPDIIYSYLWKEYIEPTYFDIIQGHNVKAKLQYIDMIRFLCEKYRFFVRSDISQKYFVENYDRN